MDDWCPALTAFLALEDTMDSLRQLFGSFAAQSIPCRRHAMAVKSTEGKK